jgi:hypothetical protein
VGHDNRENASYSSGRSLLGSNPPWFFKTGSALRAGNALLPFTLQWLEHQQAAKARP